ncbi:hypothetical protein [Nocardia sp. NPDC020380]|uniref:hypothetical protein n=1 Tax=Nocardia sp. NPDC020380 TaxID=3364309 RepID=UPI00379448B4
MPANSVEVTTIKTPRTTRDRLAALTPRGTTLAEMIEILIDNYESTKTRERIAWETRLAAARADTVAFDRGVQVAGQLLEYLERREGTRP